MEDHVIGLINVQSQSVDTYENQSEINFISELIGFISEESSLPDKYIKDVKPKC